MTKETGSSTANQLGPVNSQPKKDSWLPSACAADDLRRRHRAGVEEDRDDRQPHRDLVADHLRGAAQAAEQRVRRARGPAGQHDAVHAHRRAGEDDQDADRGVGQLQRRALAEDAHRRPERDHRERQERRDRGDDRGQEVDRLVGQRRHDVFLERQLQPVGEALQVAAPADPVGADPLLHPGDDLALEDDREQRQQHQDGEDADDLDEHDPPDVVPEVLQRRLVRGGEHVHRHLLVGVRAGSRRRRRPGAEVGADLAAR